MPSFFLCGIVLSELGRKIVTQLNCEAHAWMNSSVQKIMLVRIYCDLWYQLRECSEAILISYSLLHQSAGYLLLHNHYKT